MRDVMWKQLVATDPEAIELESIPAMWVRGVSSLRFSLRGYVTYAAMLASVDVWYQSLVGVLKRVGMTTF